MKVKKRKKKKEIEEFLDTPKPQNYFMKFNLLSLLMGKIEKNLFGLTCHVLKMKLHWFIPLLNNFIQKN
jgi:hypothetical protein